MPTSVPASADATGTEVIPCSPKHKKHCSRWHFELVQGYRLERHRQEIQHEAVTGGYAGDAAHARATGHTQPITFQDWLKANRRDHPDDNRVDAGGVLRGV
jgi:hypothetical protein